MSTAFQSIHYNVADQPEKELQGIGVSPTRLRSRGFQAADGAPITGADFSTEEAAARFYLDNIFSRHLSRRPTDALFEKLVAGEKPTLVPDLKLKDSSRSPIGDSWRVRFLQVSSAIPIFGSQVVVELDRDRQLLAVDGQVADVPENISPIASVSPAQALKAIAALTQKEAAKVGEGISAPVLIFFHNDKQDVWHLAYHFKSIQAAPADFFKGMKGHGVGRSKAPLRPQLDYLVDAADARILRYWSSTPTLSHAMARITIPDLTAPVEPPVECTGVDEDGVVQAFWGKKKGNSWVMDDPVRQIKTCDMQFNDLGSTHLSVPKEAVTTKGSSHFANHKAAVSAHVNATRVYDFYRSILMRDSVDNRGMLLLSYVNCTLQAEEAAPQWHNACWDSDLHCMWYGQEQDVSGSLKSYARYLDVIAHELTHGITHFTSDLAYMDQSGALSESFSDIFAIIIKNWYADGGLRNNVKQWNWEIGSGLGQNGGPLRNVKEPATLGDPDHMNDYKDMSEDNGGVHINCNIHNKAAYNLLTAVDATGKPVLTPQQVGMLYYLCLTRLSQLASFIEVRDTLRNVASTYFAGSPWRDEKLNAIDLAYREVGIVPERAAPERKPVFIGAYEGEEVPVGSLV